MLGDKVGRDREGVLAPRAAHDWQLHHGHQLELPAMPGAARTRLQRSPQPREPRCERCDVALAALAVEDASDPAMPRI